MTTFLTNLKEAFEDLKDLKIITVIGPMEVGIGENQEITYESPANGSAKLMVTRIDLIDGDVINIVDPAFVNGDLQNIREFHNEQVQKGNDIIVRNIDAIISLAEKIRDLFPSGEPIPPAAQEALENASAAKGKAASRGKNNE